MISSNQQATARMSRGCAPFGTQMNRILLAFLSLFLVPETAFAQWAGSNWNIPDRNVALHCAPLPYQIHCSISRLSNPQYSSNCFYVDGEGYSHLMKRDYHFGYSNPIVTVQVTDGMRISAQLVEVATGRKAQCSE
jgi:hypothetical protein